MKMYIVKKSEYKPLENKQIGLQSIGGSKNPNPSRKTLDERIAEAISKALVPVIARLDAINDRMDRNNLNP